MSLIAAACALSMGQIQVPTNRYQSAAPFPSLRWTRIDDQLASYGIANSNARRLGLQARILWVDGTANLDAVNTPEKAKAVIRKAAEIGFNTVVYDVKPIVGRTLYPSKHAPQLLKWRTATQPEGNDPLKAMSEEARAQGISFYAALNAFSEGHRYALEQPDQFGDAGWGYGKRDLQTWQYIPQPEVSFGGDSIMISPAANPKTWNHPSAIFTANVGDGKAYAALDASGKVISLGKDKPAVPAGGSVLVANPTGIANDTGLDFINKLSVGAAPRFGTKPNFAPIEDNQTQIPLMMNPHLKANQDRAMSFIEEVLQNYDVDGVIYDDRLRFGGFNADFSPTTRASFEQKIGRKLNWPDDVFRFTCDSRLGMSGFRPGPYFDAWMAFRAEAMTDWVKSVRHRVTQINPKAGFALYAGSWYGDYINYGANYASPDLQAGFPYMTRAYQKAGFADQLDFIMTGCYYPVPTIFQALERAKPTGRTVEAGGAISNRVIRDQTWTYAGIMIADYWTDKVAFEEALQAAAATTQGVMVFDYSHRIDEYWPIFERAFKTKANAPHQVPGLLEKVRKQRANWDKKGYPDPPFPLLEGAPGAGF